LGLAVPSEIRNLAFSWSTGTIIYLLLVTGISGQGNPRKIFLLIFFSNETIWLHPSLVGKNHTKMKLSIQGFRLEADLNCIEADTST